MQAPGDAFQLATGHLQAAKALDRRDQAAKALEGYQAAIQFYLLHLQTPSLESETRSEATLQASGALDRAEVLKNALSNQAEEQGGGHQQTSGDDWPSSSIKETAEHLRRAVLADRAGEMSEAIAAYKQGLVMLMDRLEWEQDPAAKAGITSKAEQYLDRTKLLIGLSQQADASSHLREERVATGRCQQPADVAMASGS